MLPEALTKLSVFSLVSDVIFVDICKIYWNHKNNLFLLKQWAAVKIKCSDKIAPPHFRGCDGIPKRDNLAIHGHSPSELSSPARIDVELMLPAFFSFETLMGFFKPHSKADAKKLSIKFCFGFNWKKHGHLYKEFASIKKFTFFYLLIGKYFFKKSLISKGNSNRIKTAFFFIVQTLSYCKQFIQKGGSFTMLKLLTKQFFFIVQTLSYYKQFIEKSGSFTMLKLLTKDSL